MADDRPKDYDLDSPNRAYRACVAFGWETPSEDEKVSGTVTASRQLTVADTFSPPPFAPPKKSKPRRWVVERTLGWLSKCRDLLVRYDKNGFNHLGLIQFACALLWYRRAHRLGAG